MQGECCLGRKLYIPGSIAADSPAGRIFAQLQKKFSVIHKDYLEASTLDADLPLWLVSNLGLSMIPRLITPHVEPLPQTIQAFEVAKDIQLRVITELPVYQEHIISSDEQSDKFSFFEEPSEQEIAVTTGSSQESRNQQMQTMLSEQQNKKLMEIAPLEQMDSSRYHRHPITKTPAPPPPAYLPGPVYTGPPSPSPSPILWPIDMPRQNSEHEITQEHTHSSKFVAQDVDRDLLSPGWDQMFEDTSTGAEKPQIPLSSKRRTSLGSLTGLDDLEIQILAHSPYGSAGKRLGESHSSPLSSPPQPTKRSEIWKGDHIGPPVEDTQSEEVKNDEKLFTLSEEFEFMFSECRTSDVLQLFRDNWHHYSKWIEGAHMKWQHGAFLAARSHLKSTLGVSRVQSAAGPLPLQETVLPKIDIELDEEALIPALDINNAQHPEWALLSNFGVLMKGDINYYLRCLIAISDGPSPNVDKVAYIYEQIQTRYRENEDIIRCVL